MAGSLTIDTLNASSGPLSTNNGMSGICKAWVLYQSAGTPQVFNSFNVSSVTYNATGSFTVNYTTAMLSSTYCVVASGRWTSIANIVAGMDSLTNSSCTILTVSTASGSPLTNGNFMNVAVFS